jgi:hypothetical protein
MTPNTNAVYQAIRDGKTTDSKARKAAGLSDEDFDAEIARLRERGWIDIDESGKNPSYQLSEKGAANLATVLPD